MVLVLGICMVVVSVFGAGAIVALGILVSSWVELRGKKFFKRRLQKEMVSSFQMFSICFGFTLVAMYIAVNTFRFMSTM